MQWRSEGRPWALAVSATPRQPQPDPRLPLHPEGTSRAHTCGQRAFLRDAAEPLAKRKPSESQAKAKRSPAMPRAAFTGRHKSRLQSLRNITDCSSSSVSAKLRRCCKRFLHFLAAAGHANHSRQHGNEVRLAGERGRGPRRSAALEGVGWSCWGLGAVGEFEFCTAGRTARPYEARTVR
jgi:hypothetical protein